MSYTTEVATDLVRPRPNIMVWHLDQQKVANSFTVEFRVVGNKQVPQIQYQLYTSPFGTRMPDAPGWQPEDISRHIH